MRALLRIALGIALVVGALKIAGVPIPVVDYPVGPIGIFDGRGPTVPDVQIEPPGFGDFPAP